MKTIASIKLILCLTTVLLAGTLALAVTNWSVQGVINWTGSDYGPSTINHKVHEEQWDQPGQPLDTHAAKEGFTFLPEGKDTNQAVSFGTLTGAAGMIIEQPVDPPYIDWYTIWVWADVNGNGKADPQDEVWADANENGKVDDGEMVPQDWHVLLHKEGYPGDYNTTSGVAGVANLLASKVQLHAGMQYLLLLEVHAHVPDGSIPAGVADERAQYGDDASSLQFLGGIARNDDGTVTVSYTEKLSESGWDPVYPQYKYITWNGEPLDEGGNLTRRTCGVDPCEIILIRVNNPPEPPRH